MSSPTPQDLNNLSPLNFKFQLAKIPHVEFRVQGVQIPGMDLGTATNATNAFIQVRDPGSLEYGPLGITFLVGQSMSDYLEIFNWMVGLGQPDGLGQYDRSFQDGTVQILNSAYNRNVQVSFTNLYPISISPLQFQSTDTDIQFITATAQFNFDRFFFETVD